MEKDLVATKAESDEKTRGLSQKDGEINLLKSQFKDKDQELKALLERAIGAEKRFEFLKEEKRK